ncbi:hypothetical protein TL16_g04266 [Triparma laevis f. inornata]|uniref:Uncharacterized protein n=1 Tax=Triparma laevis f. inornata TaxID=1714386 RepID=A0A9W7E7P1_9STRA|nr:hypothetical protein TL16_g04266 [Triparma laevis f. inornata]
MSKFCFTSNLNSYSSTIITSLLSNNGYTISGINTGGDPPFPCQSISPTDKKTRSQLIQSASVIILILDSTTTSIEDDILSALKFTTFKKPTNLIVISTLGTWGNTLSSESNPISCTSYTERIPLKKYTENKRLEDFALSLSNQNLQTNILTPGILYGLGESSFFMTFKDAWLHQNVPVLVPSVVSGEGGNRLPTCGVRELAGAVLSICETESSGLDKMFLLCDETQSTLSEITKKISENLNGTSQTRIMSSTSYESVLFEHPEFALLNINLIVDGSTSPLPMNNKSILESLPKVCEEFISCRGLEAMKIVLMAPVGNELKELAGELKGMYSLPLLTRRTVVDIVMKGEEGSNNIRDEVAKIWDAEEGGKDATKIPDKLLARCFRHCLDSGTCKSHGYVMYDFPETENDGYIMWSDEPETVEGEEKEEEEPVEEKKGKKDEKKGKKGKESPRDEPVEPVEPIVKFPLNPKKGPTHILNFPASDEYLFKLNGASPIASEGGAEPVVSEAGLKYKEMLEGYRRKVASFGARPPMATEEEKETKEDEEEGKEETKKEPEEEEKIFKSLPEWLEDKFSCKLASFPCDEKCAEELSLPVLDSTQQTSYITEFIEEGSVPGIVFMNAKSTKVKGDVNDFPSTVTADTTTTAPASTEPVAPPTTTSNDDYVDVLPHVKVYNDVSIEEAEEIQSFIDEYKNYCSQNVMKQVTLGMMEILKIKSDPTVDVIDTLADFLISEGKKLEKDGEEKARNQFDAVLKHVDEMSSRLIEGRDDSTIAGTVFSNFSSKV